MKTVFMWSITEKNIYLCLVLLLTTFASMAFGLDACPYSWLLHENLCYKRLDASATYNNAQASCEAQNANLATIPTNSANDFVRNSVVLNRVNSYWIGLREEDWSTRPWRWETGEVVVYENWSSGEPNDAGGEEDCTELLTSNGQWNDVPCSLTLSFICSQAKNIDECNTGGHNCDANADCVDTRGSFSCTCKAGYNGNGLICYDINECAGSNSLCRANEHCTNTAGSYACVCNDGFSRSGGVCTDINECIENTHDCGVNSQCLNEVGSFACSCYPGFLKVGDICTDIDECTESLDDCGENEGCINSEGSYVCACNDGFIRNGSGCIDVNECTENLHDCGVNSQCQNAEGSFTCSCYSGFQKVGDNCTDIDECSVNIHDCEENAICYNTEGNYTCPCIEGFLFDGRRCSEIFDVVCHPEYMLAKVHSYYYISEGIDLEDLHLSDMSCHGVEDPSSPDMWIFNTTTLSSCSTSLRENSTHFFYSNTINNVRTSGVYHGHPIYNTFSCVYEKDLENVSLFSFSYSVIKNVKNITAPAGLGVFSTEMNVFTDHTHTTLDTRTQYEATDSLFVMMKLGATHPDLTLVIDRCWITAAPDLNHESQYAFIENGCPVVENKNDVQITASGVGQSASFESPVFAFINYDTTYLHCSLEICSLAGGNACEPVCGLVKRSFSAHMRRGKRQADSDEDNSAIETLSVGPYIVIRDETNPNPDYVKSNDLTNTTLIAILGAVVIVVVALLVFAGVWKRGRRNVVTTQKMDVVPFSNPAMIKE